MSATGAKSSVIHRKSLVNVMISVDSIGATIAEYYQSPLKMAPAMVTPTLRRPGSVDSSGWQIQINSPVLMPSTLSGERLGERCPDFRGQAPGPTCGKASRVIEPDR